LGKWRERDQWEDICVNRRIILNLIFKKWDGMGGLDLSGSVQGQVVDSSEHRSDLYCSIKCLEVLD
jgi:hypothetical protein